MTMFLTQSEVARQLRVPLASLRRNLRTKGVKPDAALKIETAASDAEHPLFRAERIEELREAVATRRHPAGVVTTADAV